MVSVNLLASTWNLRYRVFRRGGKFEVKIIAFCQYLPDFMTITCKNFLKHS